MKGVGLFGAGLKDYKDERKLNRRDMSAKILERDTKSQKLYLPQAD
jgi:hypothetical protein